MRSKEFPVLRIYFYLNIFHLALQLKLCKLKQSILTDTQQNIYSLTRFRYDQAEVYIFGDLINLSGSIKVIFKGSRRLGIL